MKILLHHPSETDGTSFYRCFGPFNDLARNDSEITVVNGNIELSWAQITQFDLVFIQRPASPYHMDLVKLCKAYGVPVWVDWDDHYFNIPDSNPRKEFYTKYHINIVRWVARNADYITVSTQFLYEEFHKYNGNIKLIPNAIDTHFFDTDIHTEFPREKVILWRGSDTHKESLDFFKEEILELMDETPDYVWAFFGYYPEWAVEHLPSNRIRLYDYDGPIEFTNALFKIRPQIVYITLKDNEFNRSRSHVGWLEATYAGATVVAPDFPEWKRLPVSLYYKPNPDFKPEAAELIKDLNRDIEVPDFKVAFMKALSDDGRLQNKSTSMLYDYRLSKINQMRKEILMELTNTTYKLKKRGHLTGAIELAGPFSDAEFFRYGSDHGWNQDNPNWIAGQENMATYLQDKLGAQSVVDIGCGTGALLEVLRKRGVVAFGVDSNVDNFKYFKKRNPDLEEFYIQEDASNVILGNPMDVVVSIEVFEHMPDEVCHRILQNWKGNCKFFVFSSTPYHSTPEFDQQWGHINVKPTPHWIKLFEDNGFRLVQKLDFPTPWSLLFISI